MHYYSSIFIDPFKLGTLGVAGNNIMVIIDIPHEYMVTVLHSLHHACVLSVLWLEGQPLYDHGEFSPMYTLCGCMCV